jgi:hypothetical protein
MRLKTGVAVVMVLFTVFSGKRVEYEGRYINEDGSSDAPGSPSTPDLDSQKSSQL